ADTWDEFERRHGIARERAGAIEKLRYRGEFAERAQRRGGFARPWKQLEHGGRDDAERAFRADKQLAQRIAGVVLAQRAQAIPDAPIRQHDFKSEREVTRIAVAQDIDAPGIGGEVAADLA